MLFWRSVFFLPTGSLCVKVLERRNVCSVVLLWSNHFSLRKTIKSTNYRLYLVSLSNEIMTDTNCSFPRKRKSKWDIPGKGAENINSKKDGNEKLASDATQKARERAAQLAAKLAAEGKLASGIAPPPIMASQVFAQSHVNLPPKNFSVKSNFVFIDPEIIKMETGGYMAEIEINDFPARVNLTKKAVQDKISNQSGAAIGTKGRFMTSEEQPSTILQGDRPLYLNVQAPIQAKVQVAIHMIKDVIFNFGKTDSSGNGLNGTQSLNYVQEKLFVGLEFSPPEYKIKEKLQGPNGSFLQHIILQTGAKVYLRGKGSGFLEPNSGRESFEALHIYISHPRHDGLQSAKSLCESLLQSVHNDFKTWNETKRLQSPYSLQGYGQSFYPNYNIPPPNQNQISDRAQTISTGRPRYDQAPPGAYQPQSPHSDYYRNQAPPSFQPSREEPYHQSDSKPGYPPPNVPLSQIPLGYPLTGYPPPSYAPPHQQPFQVQQDSAKASEQSSSEFTSLQNNSKAEPRKRRFTEDPGLIRQSTSSADKSSKAKKEDNSHSLDSNIKFRSSGKLSKELSRDTNRLDFVSERLTADDHDSRLSHYLYDRAIDVSGVDVSKSSSPPFRPPTAVVLPFKPPTAPLLAKMTKKSKPKRTETKNALSSLIAYDDSDSE